MFIPQTSVALGVLAVLGPNHGNWPPLSPALSPDYFSLWGSPESCAPPTLPLLSPALSPWPPLSPVVPVVPRVSLCSRGSLWCHEWPLSGPRLF